MSFKTSFHLSHKIELYIPTTLYDKPITKAVLDRREKTIGRQFSDWFGGATETHSNGYYVAQDGQLIVETIRRVSSFTDSDTLKRYKSAIYAYLKGLANEWRQETLAVELDGILYFIEG